MNNRFGRVTAKISGRVNSDGSSCCLWSINLSGFTQVSEEGVFTRTSVCLCVCSQHQTKTKSSSDKQWGYEGKKQVGRELIGWAPEVQQQNALGETPARSASSLLILARLSVTVLGRSQSTHLLVIVNRVSKYTERNSTKQEHGTMFYTPHTLLQCILTIRPI